MKTLKLVLILALALVSISGCQKATTYQDNEVSVQETMTTGDTTKDKQQDEHLETKKDIKKEPIIEEPQTWEATLTSVGDIMFHVPQLKRAYNAETDSFDFQSVFQQVKPYFGEDQFVVANLETTLSGKDEGIRLDISNYFKGYQGYPTFNTPEILASQLKQNGVDMVVTANNHSMDSWTEGIRDTLKELDQAGLEHIGTYANERDQRYIIKDIQGITFGFSNYTYATNGINPPKAEEYMVNTWDNYDKTRINAMYQDIKDIKAKEKNMDVNVVYLHYGSEYNIYPSNTQKNIAKNLIASGADVIIGSHPHVLQPFEIIETVDDEGKKRKGLVIYSLGNFISSQIYLNSDPVNKDAGIITNIMFEKQSNGQVAIKGLELIPTWVQWRDETIRVIPVNKGLEGYEKGENSYGLTVKDYNRLKNVSKFSLSHMLSLYKKDDQKITVTKTDDGGRVEFREMIINP